MLILIEHPPSSYVQKVKIALREKRVAFTTEIPHELGSGRASGEFRAANPRIEVPVLIDGSKLELMHIGCAFSRVVAGAGQPASCKSSAAYSHALHYLKAVQASGTTEVIAKIREMPVNDFFAQNGVVRRDGRMVHDMYLAQVKTPVESKEPWDQFKILATVPGEKAFRPISEGGCPLAR